MGGGGYPTIVSHISSLQSRCPHYFRLLIPALGESFCRTGCKQGACERHKLTATWKTGAKLTDSFTPLAVNADL